MAKKKLSRSSIITDQKWLGREPEFKNDSEPSNVELAKLYNWYNYFHDTEDAKKFIAEYCRENEIANIDLNKHTCNTFGWVARMLSRGANLSEVTVEKFNAYLSSLHGVAVKQVDTASKEKVVVQDVIGPFIADIDEACDNYKQGFSMYQYLQDRNVGPNFVKQIQEKYGRVLAELKDAYAKKDQELVEAYSVYSRKELKELVAFYQVMVDDCERFAGNVKTEKKQRAPRKPRKPREKKMSTVMKHFKHLDRFDELKLVSEKPENIIGAQVVYLFNTVYNTLTMITASEGKTLEIHRSAIANFDEAQSGCKRIGRKTQEIITNLLGTSKRARPKLFKDIKSTAHFTNRVNEKTIILKIDR